MSPSTKMTDNANAYWIARWFKSTVAAANKFLAGDM